MSAGRAGPVQQAVRFGRGFVEPGGSEPDPVSADPAGAACLSDPADGMHGPPGPVWGGAFFSAGSFYPAGRRAAAFAAGPGDPSAKRRGSGDYGASAAGFIRSRGGNGAGAADAQPSSPGICKKPGDPCDPVSGGKIHGPAGLCGYGKSPSGARNRAAGGAA